MISQKTGAALLTFSDEVQCLRECLNPVPKSNLTIIGIALFFKGTKRIKSGTSA